MFGKWNRKSQLKLGWLEKRVELRSTDSRGRLSPQKARLFSQKQGCPTELVAAGVGLGGHQHKAWASRGRFGLRWMAERAQDAEDCDVSGEYAEADGRDHGEAEDNGHQEGNHGLKSL
jgi:hypothetical protein